MKNKVREKVRIIERKRKGISPTKNLRRGRSDDSGSETDGSSQKSIRLSGPLPAFKEYKWLTI